MRFRTIAGLIGAGLTLLAASAWADPTLQVTFPEKGGYLYWIEYKDAGGKTQITAPKHSSGESTSVDLAPAASAGKLLPGLVKFYDPKSGNVAAKKIENLTGKKDLKLKTADFDLVRDARMVLRPADGKPEERVESAVVTLQDANSDEFTAVVDPSSDGVAEFHDIAAGQETVTVAYEGGRMTVYLEVPAERDTPVFTNPIVISSKVRTVKVSAAQSGGEQSSATDEGKSESKPAKQAPPVSFAARFAQTIMGFFFLAIVGAVIFFVLRSKNATFKGSLEKMGVQFPEGDPGAAMPGTPQPDQGPQIDPNVCQFCGQRKDPATGNCACSVSPSGMSSSGSTGTPRLIAMQGTYSGRIFEMSANEITVGRDAGNTVALSDDHTVSRRHARVARDNGTVAITDEGSSNGTFVNGMKISGSRPLQPGDEIQIGSTKFRFEL